MPQVRRAGCPTCKGEGWIEVLGAGMVHPRVLRWRGHQSRGVLRLGLRHGSERPAMRQFKITDMRLIFENDVRSQF